MHREETMPRGLKGLLGEPWTIQLGFVVGTFAIAGDLWAADKITVDHKTLNYLLVIFGGVFGYCIGILTSPYGAEERQDFTEISRAASAFLSGYVLAKADRWFDDAYRSQQIDSAFFGRLALFASAFLIMATFSFVSRKYIGPPFNPKTRLMTGPSALTRS
jgi:hypothetical protein